MEEVAQHNQATPDTSTPYEVQTINVTFLVVGGGIAGVSCAEMLAICCPEERTLLLTESSYIKTVANLEPVARYLHKFDVKERSVLNSSGDNASNLAPSIQTIVDKLERIETEAKCVKTHGKRIINYRYLCICTGGRARLIEEQNRRVLGIRDTDSVLELQRRLKDAKRIVLVGNGGIASELAYELKDVEVHWIVKDKHISSTFVDAGAAHFFIQSRRTNKATHEKQEQNSTECKARKGIVKRLRYAELIPNDDKETNKTLKHGPALGPDWHSLFELSGAFKAEMGEQSLPIIHYEAKIENFNASDDGDRMKVILSNGEEIVCDFIVSATGVDPNQSFIIDKPFSIAADGGIEVNELMETSVKNIYAAGDVCTAAWEQAPHWFQMRLWTQARQMGAMAGRSMAAKLCGEKIYQDFCFELFGHVTQLFGFSVILLGRFNAQGLGTDYELLLRSTPGKEYIKFVLQNGRLRGVILIGNTELAETCENLILNGIDLTPFGDDILNPDIDIEDYFD